MGNNLPNSIFDSTVNLYREAVKRLPAIKYSWGLVAIICILALIDFFKLGNTKAVFKSALLALGIIFLIFLFSFLTKTNDKAIRYALYILTYSIILTAIALVIGFAIHTLTPLKFPFYENLLGASRKTKAANTAIKKSDTSSANITSTEFGDTQQTTAKDTTQYIRTREQKPFSTIQLNHKGRQQNDTTISKIEPNNGTHCPNLPCRAHCDTKDITGVEVSFIDPKSDTVCTYKLEGTMAVFEIPCYLKEEYISVTFTGNGLSETRNVQLKEFEIPKMFKTN